MILGTITSGDIGNWYLGSDGTVLQLKNCIGPLLYCWSPQGNLYYPIHDVMKQLAPKDVERILSKLNLSNFATDEKTRL